MVQFRCNKYKAPGKLEPTDVAGEYRFVTSNETVFLRNACKKVSVSPMEVLVEIEVDKQLEWLCFHVSSISESDNFVGFETFFKDADVCLNVLRGHDTKGKREVVAIFEDDGVFVIGSTNGVFSCVDTDVTMAVVQRNSPGTSRFDLAWCFHKQFLIHETVFDKKDINNVVEFCSDVTENIFDVGADPYNWKHFLKVQKDQNGDVDDWLGVFSSLTDEEEEDDEEEEYVDSLDGSETDESDCSWESSSDDECGAFQIRPLKKIKR